MIKPRNAIVAQQRIYVHIYIHIRLAARKAGIRSRAYHDMSVCLAGDSFSPVRARSDGCLLARSLACLLACLLARLLARSPACPPAFSSARLASFLVQAQAGGHLKEWRRHAAPHYARYWFFHDCARGPLRRARQHAPRYVSSYRRWMMVTWVPKMYVCMCVYTRMSYTWAAYIYGRKWFDLGRRAYRVATPTKRNLRTCRPFFAMKGQSIHVFTIEQMLVVSAKILFLPRGKIGNLL